VNLHPQAQGLLDGMAAQGGPPLTELTVAEARTLPGLFTELIGPGPEVAEVRDITLQGGHGPIPARVYEPVPDPVATVVYYHGGGWVIGSVDDGDAACRRLAVSSGARVVSVEYRLAPEHTFPVPLDDCYDAFVEIGSTVAGDEPLVVAGDSAGGNLATVTALRVRDEGGPAIALQLLVYPAVEADPRTASYKQYSNAGLILNTEDMAWFFGHYVPNLADRAHPHVSPLRADLTGLPPAYIVLAAYDPLLDEGLAYAAKLEAAGVPVTVVRYDDQIHAFFTMVNLMESAHAAIDRAAEVIRALGSR
jgi:acetyl esterase